MWELNVINILYSMLARKVSVDIQKNGSFIVGKVKTGGHEKMGHGISGKNYSISQ